MAAYTHAKPLARPAQFLSCKFRSDGGDMFSLEAGGSQFILAGHPLSMAACDG